MVRDELILSYIQTGVNIQITEKVTACRDPKDNIYLELAVCGKADLIISGDEDLLTMKHFKGTSIIPPAAFLIDYE